MRNVVDCYFLGIYYIQHIMVSNIVRFPSCKNRCRGHIIVHITIYDRHERLNSISCWSIIICLVFDLNG